MRSSATSGANLLNHFESRPARDKNKPFRFYTRGKAVDRRGDVVLNEFTIVAISPNVYNQKFSQVKVLYNNTPMHLRIQHNNTYVVPLDQ